MQFIGIYPEWNVKQPSPSLHTTFARYWNISRMECKVKSSSLFQVLSRIGIYPEWNVKLGGAMAAIIVALIGIYPEWNVKNRLYTLINLLRILEYIQNGM